MAVLMGSQHLVRQPISSSGRKQHLLMQSLPKRQQTRRRSLKCTGMQTLLARQHEVMVARQPGVSTISRSSISRNFCKTLSHQTLPNSCPPAPLPQALRQALRQGRPESTSSSIQPSRRLPEGSLHSNRSSRRGLWPGQLPAPKPLSVGHMIR